MNRFGKLLAAILFATMSLPAFGQVLIDNGGSALDNASGGAVRGRAPGIRVNQGVAQHVNFGGIPNVTEPAPQENAARQYLLVESINTVFDQLNSAILLFRELLLARAGRPSSFPTGNKATDSLTADGTLPTGRLVKGALERLQSANESSTAQRTIPARKQ